MTTGNARRRTVALLPMKAHSERVPGKNFRPLAGKPLFRWTLETLLEVGEIDQVIINTDARRQLQLDAAVADPRVALRDRTPELCGDTVSMNLILADDIRAVAADRYVMTHATNPLLSAETIRRALRLFDEVEGAGTGDSIFSVTRHQARFYDPAGRPMNHDPANLVRTQDLDPLFEENSCLYVFTNGSFVDAGARIGRRAVMFETPALESLDIDEESDWALVEAYLTAQGGTRHGD
ncbi:MAG TPA: acylneuraminate cytidylyltransferase family protein [Vicinamibacterales bacterium]|nr:acylneuraminate cytidylyltransferase family protein [Vicinamibacterales bacterium]